MSEQQVPPKFPMWIDYRTEEQYVSAMRHWIEAFRAWFDVFTVENKGTNETTSSCCGHFPYPQYAPDNPYNFECPLIKELRKI